MHNKDGFDHQAEGLGKQIKGKTNEVVGAVTGDTSQELKGKLQKNVDKAQERFGESLSEAETDRDLRDRERLP
jgi:uncharacterized protein YjbJ (UPF0337 family)